LNDSFAHIKRELASGQQTNEMVDFMWSAFRKVAGVNNKKPTNEDEDDQDKKNISTIFDSMSKTNGDAPLANFEIDDL
jgi:hypothetical protein